ncbi:MAG: helix-turn-helix transcriptional regulator [Haliscomenobacter sp.]|nr:helix-turn-helix transcriptional regulator [Haliscomenobacter sp.]MBK7477376.1 helix-turn-helix transcriptional regulator [Haliscomenobacter sp.]MBK8880103.1 helix-turn-helix transcriptional regulator [Haliscomenobacter sp.]
MNQMSAAAMINWESEAVLSQIADKISRPLKEIIRLSRYIYAHTEQGDAETNRLSAIVLESSAQLETIVANIIKAEKQKQIEIVVRNKFQFPHLYQWLEALEESSPLDDILAKSDAFRIPKSELSWLLRLERTILEHLESSMLSISWLAQEMMVSERQLFRKIEKYTGLTPNNYIRKIRLWKARRLLEDYACTNVCEVAIRVGIRDPYYFSKLFAKEFGKMPRQYLQAG